MGQTEAPGPEQAGTAGREGWEETCTLSSCLPSGPGKEKELGLPGVPELRREGWSSGRGRWGEGWAGRGRYLRSMFAGHPWHAPFSLKEEIKEGLRRGPDLPEASALESRPVGVSRSPGWLVWRVGTAVQLTMSSEDPAATAGCSSELRELTERPPRQTVSPAESESRSGCRKSCEGPTTSLGAQLGQRSVHLTAHPSSPPSHCRLALPAPFSHQKLCSRGTCRLSHTGSCLSASSGAPLPPS